ncbi:MAG: phosphoribosylaminoimidazolesuccinocarboxamide synthase [Candidatus Levyibacteriota bacterium]|nr:MAG: phosphoribosylaminoimidazolesuccinocarboxamide synthase [Candidatus Levybacteria bacterium]
MNVLKTVDLTGFGKKYSGKVRDWYIADNKRILITTDRISAFDRILGHIPYKGQVLNLLSAFWFSKTNDIIDNHMISVPDPNVMIGKNATPVPIEVVVRGYISGVTNTSIWGSYQKGERTIYGIQLPEGLRKNQKLPTPIITPTTKAETGHDERLTRKEIIERNIVAKDVWEQIEDAAIRVFQRGSEIAEEKGLILVDTKYEFGMLDGKVLIIDEMHTPDSSRFWKKDTYEQRFSQGLEPENFDKEFLRIWFKDHGYTGDGEPPTMPDDFIMQVSKRYQDVYEILTEEKLLIDEKENIEERIKRNLTNFQF